MYIVCQNNQISSKQRLEKGQPRAKTVIVRKEILFSDNIILILVWTLMPFKNYIRWPLNLKMHAIIDLKI